MANGVIADRISKVLYKEHTIQERIHEIGQQISHDYSTREVAKDFEGRPPILVCVLRGAMMFMSDLARKIPTEVEYDFICVFSYRNGTSPGAVQLVKDVDIPITGRDVLIVEDIVDTGYTASYIRRSFAARDPASLRICALIDKAARREKEIKIDYRGFVLERDEFVVGYGMDYRGIYRNLPFIGLLKDEYVQ